MKKKKFNFVEYFPHEEVPDKKEVLKVSLNCKNGILFFGPKIVRTHDMDNKLIKFYYDTEKNALAWKYFDRATQEQLEGMRLVKRNSNGVITISLKKLLKRFLRLNNESTLPGLPVEQYKDSLLDKNSLYYVILKK